MPRAQNPLTPILVLTAVTLAGVLAAIRAAATIPTPTGTQAAALIAAASFALAVAASQQTGDTAARRTRTARLHAARGGAQ
jgi:hypothetical protein